jgi:sulfur carrier protein
MKLRLNGKPYETRSGITVAELLLELDLGTQRMAVAVNGEVTPKSRRARHTLEEGDEVEVIHAVAGG